MLKLIRIAGDFVSDEVKTKMILLSSLTLIGYIPPCYF
jgi:AP-2 complex subunit alpha